MPFARIADPDSAGRLFVVDTASVVESEPPFAFRNAQLTVRHLGGKASAGDLAKCLVGENGNGGGHATMARARAPRDGLGH